MMTDSQAPNDCVIVAFCNYLGLDYDAVVRELQEIADKSEIKWQRFKGTPTFLSRVFLMRRGIVSRTVPRRGQEKLSGIVSLHSAGASQGHMAAIIDGHVFDTNVRGMPIREYQSKFVRKHIRAFWR